MPDPVGLGFGSIHERVGMLRAALQALYAGGGRRIHGAIVIKTDDFVVGAVVVEKRIGI